MRPGENKRYQRRSRGRCLFEVELPMIMEGVREVQDLTLDVESDVRRGQKVESGEGDPSTAKEKKKKERRGEKRYATEKQRKFVQRKMA